ncbi:MAG: hypothetical protein K2R93_14350 [Gemmatimonadaceae bacterium]|nr:hypothetical protein [Gemmatimonadaceae bacterium]
MSAHSSGAEDELDVRALMTGISLGGDGVAAELLDELAREGVATGAIATRRYRAGFPLTALE